ncbi:MAG: bifunctional (p)ppGpp synthetase/guanosine-3',5'-bis(diphosphate) 3'-pyrophosphohydrolase [Candidatus Yanofskybacteria bacterium]|nr:bifunctional (p)ppGpp synthetase/guanosine-3',5'-bis(diphosphate) 3'-pyrophosphohydrolase [Candidatus Yanofskybacteria bacterium]
MTRDKFFEIIDKKMGFEGREQIEWAYVLAKQFHREQVRDEGVRYFEHCRDVALILIKYGPTNPDELIVGLLHDVYEDQFVPRGMIRQLFGNEVDEALKALSHEKLFYKSHGKITKTPENKKEYFDSIKRGSILIRRVKLADRLHNLLTLEFCKPEKRIRKIKETMAHILPIAQETDLRFLKAIKNRCDYWERKS